MADAREPTLVIHIRFSSLRGASFSRPPSRFAVDDSLPVVQACDLMICQRMDVHVPLLGLLGLGVGGRIDGHRDEPMTPG